MEREVRLNLSCEDKALIEALIDELRRANDLQEKERYDPLFSRTEAADYCKVSVDTISHWTRNGRIQKVRRGARMGILKSELDIVKKI